MKKLIKTLVGVCLHVCLATPAQASSGDCDTSVKTSNTATGSAQIRFRKVMYNYPTTGKSTWFYTLKSGKKPAISHIVIGVGSCVGVTEMGKWTTYAKSGWDSYSLQSKGTDPTCGLYGIKFDYGFDDNETRNYYIVVNGNYQANSNGAMSIKASTKCSEVNLCIPSCSALPVELLNFNATTDGSQVKLNWATASENDINEYVLERSNNGVDFNEIANIEANRIANSHYELNDRNPQGNNVYYRLKEISTWGTVTILAISHLVLNEKANPENLQVRAFPNPFSNTLSISASQAEGNINIELMDLKGNTVSRQNVAVNNSDIQLGNLENLASGIYIVRLTTNSSIHYTQVVKN